MLSTDTNVIQFYLLGQDILVHAYLDIFIKKTGGDIQQGEMLGFLLLYVFGSNVKTILSYGAFLNANLV